MIKDKYWWWLSTLFSAGLIVVLIQLWDHMNSYEIQNPQLVNAAAVDAFLNKNWPPGEDTVGDKKLLPAVRIKTGIFIQSLDFNNSSDVNITGYIWQHFDKDLHTNLIPAKDEINFILPEEVNSGFEAKETYRVEENNSVLVGWYFEATLRQPFEYKTYPFDHKTVWVRMWPKQFSENIILVPDFDAYKATGTTDIFGIEESIVLGTWVREDTYFDYQLASYDTNFGIQDYIGQKGFPELRYNIVVKRKFENAFIVYLLPLFLVASLLFAALLTVSCQPEITDRLGFNASGFIGASSALFFVVMLAHIQLREQFSGSSIVYIEYFYILMYLFLVITTANTYLFSIRRGWFKTIIQYNDNAIPKLLYWPVLISSLIAVTLYVIYSTEQGI